MKKISLSRKYRAAAGVAAGVMVVSLCGGTIGANDKKAVNESKAVYAATESDADTEDLVGALNEKLSVTSKDVDKEETVYVFADANGNKETVLVNEHLMNLDKDAKLVDKTDLTDISNVKGDENFTVDGDTITWDANGADIDYQGTSTKALPVNVKVTYKLNGVEMSADEIAGKSGSVTVRFDYESTEQIEGVTVPFLALSGFVLNDNFDNISVTNGKFINEGNVKAVVGYALPGLTDGLNIEGTFSNGFEIPEYFEVTADVVDFELDMTMTLVTTLNGVSFNEEGLDLSSIDESINLLTGSSAQLADGSGKLKDGVSTLNDNMAVFEAGMTELKTGIGTLKTGSTDLANGVATLNASASSINNGIQALDKGLNTPLTDAEKQAYSAQAIAAVDAKFAEGTDTYNYIYKNAQDAFVGSMTSDETKAAIKYALSTPGADGSSVKDAIKEAVISKYIAAAIQANPEYGAMTYAEIRNAIISSKGAEIDAVVDAKLNEMVASMTTGLAENGKNKSAGAVVVACKQSAEQAAAEATVGTVDITKKQVASQIEAKQANGYSLVTGSAALAAGTDKLDKSVPTFTAGINQLYQGADKLETGTKQISAGVDQLLEGAITLNNGMVQFDEQGINKLASLYNGDFKALLSGAEKVLDAANSYQGYSLVNEGDVVSTKFIIKTEAVKAN